MSETTPRVAEKNDAGVFDEMVDECVDEIENAIEAFVDDEGVDGTVIDAALYTCAVQHAVDSMIDRADFLEMMGNMFDESKEMGALEEKFSLTRGDA